MTRIALIDYGAGNLRSVEKALQTTGAQVRVTDNPDDLAQADKLVLPGVGAFASGMAGLRRRGLIEPLLRLAHEKPLLGICLGMQLLFERSEEMGDHPGLGLLPGRVLRFPEKALKIPQTGWNQLDFAPSPLFDGLEPGCYVYFNHAYYCAPALQSDVLAVTAYGLDYASVVGGGRLYGVQFHPEKSQAVGLQILRNFVEAG